MTDLIIPKGSILENTIDIDGYKFFHVNNVVQCATCLEEVAIKPRENIVSGEVRKLKLVKDCDCPKQYESRVGVVRRPTKEQLDLKDNPKKKEEEEEMTKTLDEVL